MSKKLIIFGSEGALGLGATSTLLEKGYDYYYLINRSFNQFSDSDRVKTIIAEDLSIESNVEAVYSSISFNQDDQLFVFSTIGGFAGGVSIEETGYDTWKKMITLNLEISFLIAKHFITLAKKVSGSSILYTSALASINPAENNAAYSVSKNALNFLVKSLALEGKKYNLSTNAILPFVIDTPGNREWVEDTSIMVTPSQIGNTVHTIFENYQTFSGNLVKLPGTMAGVK